MQDAERRKQRYHLRLLLWLLLLALVLLYAYGRERRLKSDWSSPTSVALVLVDASAEYLDEEAVDALRARVPVLERQLRAEFERYRPGVGLPFEFAVFGPVTSDIKAPRFAPEGLWSLVKYNFELWRFARRCDQLAELDANAFQVKIYLRARAPRAANLQWAEGASLEGGPVGIIDVELAPGSVDFALFVAAHELFHTRGASDKYGPDGLALFPDGYADPTQNPLYPQLGAEVMARGRPVSPDQEEAPGDIEELTVGALTAVEVGWAVLP